MLTSMIVVVMTVMTRASRLIGSFHHLEALAVGTIAVLHADLQVFWCIEGQGLP